MARKPPPAKSPRRWRIVFVAKKGRPLGAVQVPDLASAIEPGAKRFGVDPARLVAQPVE